MRAFVLIYSIKLNDVHYCIMASFANCNRQTINLDRESPCKCGWHTQNLPCPRRKWHRRCKVQKPLLAYKIGRRHTDKSLIESKNHKQSTQYTTPVGQCKYRKRESPRQKVRRVRNAVKGSRPTWIQSPRMRRSCGLLRRARLRSRYTPTAHRVYCYLRRPAQ